MKETETMNDTVPVRVTIECQGRQAERKGLPVWRLYPYGPSGHGLILDTSVENITVEELTPPREWREHDVVQVWLDDPWGPPRTLICGQNGIWHAPGVGVCARDDEVTASVERQEPLRGRAVTDVLVLRYQTGETVCIPYADATDKAAS